MVGFSAAGQAAATRLTFAPPGARFPMREERSSFKRPWWLFGRHAETLFGAFSPAPPIRWRRVWADTGDGDEFALDYRRAADPAAPALIIFHGLEGCSQSANVRRLAAGFIAAGWSVACPNWRGCGGRENRSERAYHAADVDEVDHMIETARRVLGAPAAAFFGAGFSLGGAALVKWLAQNPGRLRAAAAVSTPFDLTHCGGALDSPFTLAKWIYGRYFLSKLRAKVRAKIRRFPDLAGRISESKLSRARTLRAFDDLYTAPLHGFDDATTYWRRASTVGDLARIETPLLCVNARNDPMIPPESLPAQATVSSSVVLLFPPHGGHGSFIGRPRGWLYAEVSGFFDKLRGASGGFDRKSGARINGANGANGANGGRRGNGD